jgi:hypothetical protein
MNPYQIHPEQARHAPSRMFSPPRHMQAPCLDDEPLSWNGGTL